jgi:NAD(P)-dependent dehydrogenase (short-subunit alcohol dehydrogenase family)
MPHYQSARAEVRIFIAGMALELASTAFRPKAVARGVVETDLTRASLSNTNGGPYESVGLSLGDVVNLEKLLRPLPDVLARIEGLDPVQVVAEAPWHRVRRTWR